MKKAIHIIALVTLLALTACAEAPADEAAPERVEPVHIAPVETGQIYSRISYAGVVRAAENIAVAGRVQGMVADVMFDTGDFVNENDILFTMDPVDLQNNVNSLRAQLDTADAAVNAARTGVAQAAGSAMQQQILQATGGLAQAETQVEQATLALSQAQSAFDTATQNYNDTLGLFTAGVASRMQMDQAESARNNAQIALEQAENNLGLAETGLAQARDSHELVAGNMPAETRQRAQDALSQAIAQRNSISVNLSAALERLSDAAVRSPISGVVASRNVEPSTMLTPGIPPFTIVSADMVRISVEVTELIINTIEVGDSASIYISAAAEEPFTGEVATVSPTANEMTSTFTVEVDVDNRAGLIRPGMFAEVFFIREQAQGVVVIPRGAIVLEDGEEVVYLATEIETRTETMFIDDEEITRSIQVGRALRRPVVTGIDTGTEIEILDGLSPGDELIVRGQDFVTDGMAIQVVEV